MVCLYIFMIFSKWFSTCYISSVVAYSSPSICWINIYSFPTVHRNFQHSLNIILHTHFALSLRKRCSSPPRFLLKLITFSLQPFLPFPVNFSRFVFPNPFIHLLRFLLWTLSFRKGLHLMSLPSGLSTRPGLMMTQGTQLRRAASNAMWAYGHSSAWLGR